MAGRSGRGGQGGPPRAIGYVWVSDSELAAAGEETLSNQRAAIALSCRAEGLKRVEVVDETGGPSATLDRPALAGVLERLDRGEVAALVVANLDRLSWSVRDLATLFARAGGGGWRLVVVDVGVDTSTAAGRKVVDVVVTLAELEQRRTSQRTREALATSQRQGVRLGRPQVLSPEIIERIVSERSAGKSLPKIAEGLNTDGVPTAQGGQRWYASTVRAVLARHRG